MSSLRTAECSICNECFSAERVRSLLPCMHAFCAQCLRDHFQTGGKACPMCRGRLKRLESASLGIGVTYNELSPEKQDELFAKIVKPLYVESEVAIDLVLDLVDCLRKGTKDRDILKRQGKLEQWLETQKREGELDKKVVDEVEEMYAGWKAQRASSKENAKLKADMEKLRAENRILKGQLDAAKDATTRKQVIETADSGSVASTSGSRAAKSSSTRKPAQERTASSNGQRTVRSATASRSTLGEAQPSEDTFKTGGMFPSEQGYARQTAMPSEEDSRITETSPKAPASTRSTDSYVTALTWNTSSTATDASFRGMFAGEFHQAVEEFGNTPILEGLEGDAMEEIGVILPEDINWHRG